MKQIVFTTPSPPHKYESGFTEAKFPAKKNDYQTGSLTVETLLPEDSGVYFCAVSQHSDTGDRDSCTNIQLLVSERFEDICVYIIVSRGSSRPVD